VMLAGSLATVITMPQIITHGVTTGSTQTITHPVTTTSTRTITYPVTTTSTSTETITTGNANSSCLTTPSLPILPVPNAPWFTAGVNYSGPWEALAVVYNQGSPTFSGCYTGDGQGYFIYQASGLSSTASIRITATKLDGSPGTLFAAVNGNTNSTNVPYGSATVSALVNMGSSP